MNFFSSEGGSKAHTLAIEPGEYILEPIKQLITRPSGGAGTEVVAEKAA
jgi:hypothetical protein